MTSTWNHRYMSAAVLVVAGALISSSAAAVKDILKEYCEEQTFEARCAADEVIVMVVARYGRMRAGSCLSSSYGSFGCGTDIMGHVDTVCSGQRSCKLNVRDLLVYSPCPRDLRGYLEAQFTCVKVVSPDVERCRQRAPISVADSPNGNLAATPDGQPAAGYLANLVAELTGCGNIDSPWRIQALPGQKINFTLFDFGEGSGTSAVTGGASGSGQPAGSQLSGSASAYVCQVVAIIKDRQSSTTSETVCGGRPREKHITISTSHDVEVRMATVRRYILIKYEVIGCPDIPVSAETTFKRTLTGAVIGCKHRGDIWRLTCQKNQWHGQYGNCTDGDSSVSGAMTRGFMHLPISVNVLIMSVVAILIGFVILFGGLVFVRRRLQASKSARVPTTTTGASADLYYQQKSQLYADYRLDSGGSSFHQTTRPSLIPHRLDSNAGQGKLAFSSGGPTASLLGTSGFRPSGRCLPTPGQHLFGDSVNGFEAESPRYVEHIYESPTCLRKDYEVCGLDEGSTGTNFAPSAAPDANAAAECSRMTGMGSSISGAPNAPWCGGGGIDSMVDPADRSTGSSLQYYVIDPSRKQMNEQNASAATSGLGCNARQYQIQQHYLHK